MLDAHQKGLFFDDERNSAHSSPVCYLNTNDSIISVPYAPARIRLPSDCRTRLINSIYVYHRLLVRERHGSRHDDRFVYFACNSKSKRINIDENKTKRRRIELSIIIMVITSKGRGSKPGISGFALWSFHRHARSALKQLRTILTSISLKKKNAWLGVDESKS